MGVEKMHDEESYDMHVSLNIQAMKSSRMRWVEHVARMGGGKAHTRFFWENLREGGNVGTLDMDRRVMLKNDIQKLMGAWIGLNWLSAGRGVGLF
jgi:GT2 family glycosyltransferase